MKPVLAMRVGLLSPVSALLVLVACGGGNGPPSNVLSPTPPNPSADPCTIIRSTAEGVPTIVNGADCGAAIASVVLLRIEDPAGKSLDCSGTVIAPRAVLTAGHCLTGQIARVQVSLAGTLYDATSFEASPSYVADDSSPVDIGVVLVGQNLPARPLPLLLSRDAIVGEQAVIAGWGLDQNKIGSQLRAGRTTISGVKDFLETDVGIAAAACQGDSGGTLLVSQNGTWSQAGVISGGSNSSCTSGKSYYAIVRNPAAMSFILGLAPNAIRQ